MNTIKKIMVRAIDEAEDALGYAQWSRYYKPFDEVTSGLLMELARGELQHCDTLRRRATELASEHDADVMYTLGERCRVAYSEAKTRIDMYDN